MEKETFSEWAKILIGCVSFAFTVTVFFYANFQTKAEADNNDRQTQNYLMRIDKQIDRVNEKLDIIFRNLSENDPI